MILPDEISPPIPGVVVCHPHPQYGGDMRNSVVVGIIHGLLAQGLAALRFNFRGAGRSTGTYSEGAGEQEAALASFAALSGHDCIDSKRLALAGYSFGAGIVLSVAPHLPKARGFAVIAPPTQSLSSPNILSYKKPKLIVAGDMDPFSPREDVQVLVGRMEGEAHLRILAGADHFFEGHENQIGQSVGSFCSSLFI